MFLRHRSRQAECFDELSRPLTDIARDYAELDRVNRVFRHADPFVRILSRAPRPERWRRAEILEIGAGSGGLAQELAAWAEQRGWSWAFTCLDLNPAALQLNPLPRKVRGEATALPFADGSFDLVIASQMTHHLEDEAVVRHFREAWRVTRQGLLISDLHRHPLLLALVSLAAPCLGLSARMRADGRLSVRRGFRVDEWRAAARTAGIPRAEVSVQFGCRIVLWADRGSATIEANAPNRSTA